MSKKLLIWCISLFIIFGMVQLSHAFQISSSESPFWGGIDFETERLYDDPTVLIIDFDSGQEIIQTLTPEFDFLADFDAHPEVDLFFGYESMAQNVFLALSEYLSQFVVLENSSIDTTDFGQLDSDEFQAVSPGESLELSFDDLLVVGTSGLDFWVIGAAYIPGLEEFTMIIKQVMVNTSVPEPSVLMLMSLGITGLIAIVRRKKVL